jgi:hypothetical protein
LRSTIAAARLSFTWFRTRKSLTLQQMNQAADSFGVDAKFLSAGKNLLDTSHPASKVVAATKGRCQSYWRAISLSFPESGVRLIPPKSVADFDQQVGRYRDELNDAVKALDRRYGQLRTAARQRMGDLFDPQLWHMSFTEFQLVPG